MATGERFRLFVDVDLPSDRESYKRQRRSASPGKGAVYVLDERADVQVWLSGTPDTLRLLAHELTSIAEEVEMTMTAQGSE